MRRLHLFEFGDQAWFPTLFRDFATDYLETLFTRTKIYAPVVPLIARLLRETGAKRITDLCSGAGGRDPMACARAIIEHRYILDGTCLLHHRGAFHGWTGAAWPEKDRTWLAAQERTVERRPGSPRRCGKH